jgi:hypothetical protein
MNYITRNLEKVVNQVTKEYPVVLVTGACVKKGYYCLLAKMGSDIEIIRK